MLYDFLATCSSVLADETRDFHFYQNYLKQRPVLTAMMPVVIEDLYPCYALSCTSGKDVVSPDVYIMPVAKGARNRFEDIVNDFYLNDEIRGQLDIGLEEMILLETPAIEDTFAFENGREEYNVILCHLIMPNGKRILLLAMPVSPDECWKKIFEPYKIKCSVLVDSHKGLCCWIEDTRLYGLLRESKNVDLLPGYYFKGRYISHGVPAGFHLEYTIPEEIKNLGVGRFEKEIYSIDWDENRRTPEERL